MHGKTFCNTMILVPHNSEWKMAFRKLEHVYKDVLGELLLSVEHVGSTAIEGIRAKPILDIDLVIENYSTFSEVNQRLESLGYQHNGDQGIPQREAFKRTDEKVPYWSSGCSWMDHHLYVCPTNSRELRRHIVFRDFLNHHGESRIQYEAIKKEIESRSRSDRKIYANIKENEGICSAFIESVLTRAEQDA